MKNANTCTGRVKVNVDSFINWLMMCSYTEAKVTAPQSVIEKVKKRANDIWQTHK